MLSEAAFVIAAGTTTFESFFGVTFLIAFVFFIGFSTFFGAATGDTDRAAALEAETLLAFASEAGLAYFYFKATFFEIERYLSNAKDTFAAIMEIVSATAGIYLLGLADLITFLFTFGAAAATTTGVT